MDEYKRGNIRRNKRSCKGDMSGGIGRAEICWAGNSDSGSRNTHRKTQDQAEIKLRLILHRHCHRWQIRDLEIQK